MAQGKWKRTLLGIQGLVGHRQAPDWSFIYEVSGTKNPKWEIGDHVVLPDGREFVYAKSSGVCWTGGGVQFNFVGVQAHNTVVNAQVVGDKVITVNGGTHTGLTKDQLRGGYVITWPAANKDQFRGIIGNDAADAGEDFKIYLDGPLTVDLSVGTGVEVFQNPYGALQGYSGSGSSVKAKAGVPAAYVSASGKYFWVQKSGPAFVAPQADMITNIIGAYFRHDGSIQADQGFSGLDADYDTTQYAGHRIMGDKDNIGPLFMLQG